jgi:serine/threonine protein kinase
MVTRPGRMYAGGAGVLKITDFGTSCFCEGDANAQHTAGTPPFFAPELCSKELSGTYDARVVDLWAAGVTIYMWICGRPPIPTPPAGSSAAATVMLMHNIANVEPQIAPPPEASEGLAVLITSLLTKKHEERLTLSQARARRAPPHATRTTRVLPRTPARAASRRITPHHAASRI